MREIVSRHGREAGPSLAAAFHASVFTVLGAGKAVMGALGLGLGWMVGQRAAASAAVLAGVVILLVIAGNVLRGGGDEARIAPTPSTS